MLVTVALATFAERFKDEPDGYEFIRHNSRIIEIIEKSGEIILKSLRKGDMMCRWNSHQILIMFANLSAEDAEIAMAKLNAAIQDEILKEVYDMYYAVMPLSHAGNA
jgi:hypothetical protein